LPGISIPIGNLITMVIPSFDDFWYGLQKGDRSPVKDEIKAPEGWEWEDEWQVDLNRAVDEYGQSATSFLQA